jgi:dihydrofolate reductase
LKTQYYTAATLDGFIADEHNSLDWLFQFGADPEGVGDTGFSEFMREVGAVAMGSTTYRWLLDHEVRPKDGPARPWPYTQPTWVFSSREQARVDGADIRFVRGDVRPVHAEMTAAARGKNLWLVGGGDLVGQFHDHALLDELIVSIAPVTVGRGAPLLPRRITTPPLLLRESRTMGGAFVQVRYEVAKPAGGGR